MDFLSNLPPWLVAAVAWAVGILSTLVTGRLVAKRGILSFTVHHDRVGLSAADPVFGAVQVTWNGNAVANLYATTVDLANESLRDFENVMVRVFTTTDVLLTERTELVGTSQIVSWAPDYTAEMAVPAGQPPTAVQMQRYVRDREYVLPVLNRGQAVRFVYLVSTTNAGGPSVWLDIVHAGLKLKYRVRHLQMMGVPQPHAALAGVLVAALILVGLVMLVDETWVVGTMALVLGFVAQVPGALLIKGWRWARAQLGD